MHAASQSLASVALARSEEEAKNILKPPPKKEDRPAINLADKLKFVKSPRINGNNLEEGLQRKVLSVNKLPSRKVIEIDKKCVDRSSEASKLKEKKSTDTGKADNKCNDAVEIKQAKRKVISERNVSPKQVNIIVFLQKLLMQCFLYSFFFPPFFFIRRQASLRRAKSLNLLTNFWKVFSLCLVAFRIPYDLNYAKN